jgi:hypothetical protein
MCKVLATLHTCITLCYNVNCVISKKMTGKGEGIPPLLTLIVFPSSIMFFKTGICECFIFHMIIVFIYTMSSFRQKKGIRTKEGFPHCLLHSLDLSCLHTGLSSMKDTG